MRTWLSAFTGILAWCFCAPGAAFEPMNGEFVAASACPAVQSIKKGTNPGRIKVRVNQSYPVTGLNEPQGEYVQIKVAGAKPPLRWVALSCGRLGDESPAGQKYVLAISWQPAFCETKPNKSECQTQRPDRFDAKHFTLHGLWPQPENNLYCGVSDADKTNDKRNRWDTLPEPALSMETRTQLNEVMPGTASKLHRHEYIKHGTCYRGDADTYFRTALNLMDQINRSPLQQWMASHIGQSVSAKDLKREFEKTFGSGAAAALEIHCVGDVDSRRTLISELQINLKHPLTAASPLAQSLDTSVPARSDCTQGIVDPVGLN